MTATRLKQSCFVHDATNQIKHLFSQTLTPLSLLHIILQFTFQENDILEMFLCTLVRVRVVDSSSPQCWRQVTETIT